MEIKIPEGNESLVDERFVVGTSRSWVRAIAESSACPRTCWPMTKEGYSL